MRRHRALRRKLLPVEEVGERPERRAEHAPQGLRRLDDVLAELRHGRLGNEVRLLLAHLGLWFLLFGRDLGQLPADRRESLFQGITHALRYRSHGLAHGLRHPLHKIVG